MKNIFFECPVCGAKLFRSEKSFLCENNHCFDVSKKGYVNLLMANHMKSKNPGDDKLMVDARQSFLRKGYYEFLSDKLNDVINGLTTGHENVILDAGCGEGYYTNRLKKYLDENQCLSNIIGIDISKYAVSRAVLDNGNEYAVSSIFAMPISNESCDILYSVFAPYCDKEFKRVLKTEGKMILVIPGKRHLFELKEIVYETPYENTIKDFHIDEFELIEKYEVREKGLINSSEDIENLFAMTPYYYKTNPLNRKKLHSVTSLNVTFEFIILVYQKCSQIS